jgi:hypothetical protein
MGATPAQISQGCKGVADAQPPVKSGLGKVGAWR